MTKFTFHDNNSHHESLTDWIWRNKIVDNNYFDDKIRVRALGHPEIIRESIN